MCPQLKKDETSASSSANVQMEAFYAAAKDADYLIYNSSIDGEVADLQELKGRMNCWASSGQCRRGMCSVLPRTCIRHPWSWELSRRIFGGC